MRNYLLTGIVTITLGLGVGFYIGWVQYPVEYRNSYMCQLSDDYQEDYTLMVARGYQQDGDLSKALDRLQPLRAVGIPECDDGRSYQIDNLPEWVQILTERYISQGADPALICQLVTLAEGFGRVTPIMQSSCS
jgi:hypothetical protein